jgi:hypothetical protein
MKILSAALIISALLTQASYAQSSIPGAIPTPPDEDARAEAARKKADEKANDEAYKATMKRLPDSSQKVDPWGNIRTPSANGSK